MPTPYHELAAKVGISRSQTHAILRQAEIKPHLLEQWLVTDFAQPEFEERAGEICGLYLDPPENTLVVSIDEKTGSQAKGLVRPDVQARPRAPARRDNEYKRNGTQNLFAALQVHSGEVAAMPSKTRNRFDLIRFLDQLEAEVPDVDGRRVIAITDNLSTRTAEEVEQWLAEHPRWRFCFTPKHASWLNQIEILFSILARRLLKAAAVRSPAAPSTRASTPTSSPAAASTAAPRALTRGRRRCSTRPTEAPTTSRHAAPSSASTRPTERRPVASPYR